MKRTVFAVFLLSFCGIVSAEWVLVNSDADKKTEHYFDSDTVRNSDQNYKKVWLLSSYGEKQRGGYQSLKTLYEFDCEADRTRSYTMLLYSGAMAKGNTIGAHHDELKEWFDYPETSFFKRISASICEK
jgi:hypothetical protein